MDKKHETTPTPAPGPFVTPKKVSRLDDLSEADIARALQGMDGPAAARALAAGVAHIAKTQAPQGWEIVEAIERQRGLHGDDTDPGLLLEKGGAKHALEMKEGKVAMVRAVQQTQSLGSKRGKRGKRGGKRARRQRGVPNLPSYLDVVDVVPFHRRYQNSSSASSVSVTRGSLALALGCMGTVSNSTVVGWAGSFKLKYVRCWPPTGANFTFDWAIGTAEQALNREKIIVDQLPTGITLEKGMQYTPPRGSYLSGWNVCNSNATDPLFTMSVGAGAIVDVVGVYTINPGVINSNVSKTGMTTVAVGSIYYLCLDLSNKFAPLGLASTS